MKIRLLKQLRKEFWNKYEVRKSDAVNCQDKPWHIYTGPNTCLAYHEYSTRDEAIEACKLLWHEFAEKYLWNHREQRKRNKYPW